MFDRIVRIILIFTFALSSTEITSFSSTINKNMDSLRPSASALFLQGLGDLIAIPSAKTGQPATIGAYQKLLSLTTNGDLEKRLAFLRDELGIYPGDDYLTALKLMTLTSKDVKERVNALNNITDKYNCRFDFNLCPALLAVDGRTFYAVASELAKMKIKTPQALGEIVKKAVKKQTWIELKGEFLKEYYREFQNPVFEFVDLEKEFELAEKEKSEDDEKGAEFKAKNKRPKKEFNEFFAAKLYKKSFKEKREFYEKHKKPKGKMRIRATAHGGRIYMIKLPGAPYSIFYLGKGYWDPEKGEAVAKAANGKLHCFAKYKDKTLRYLWIEVILLKDGRRGILLYLHKRGKPVGFAIWNEKERELDNIFSPADIAYSNSRTGSHYLFTKWIKSEIEMKSGRLLVTATPVLIKKKTQIIKGVKTVIKRKGIFIPHINKYYLPEEGSIEEPEGIIETVTEDRRHRRIKISGRGKDGSIHFYAYLYYGESSGGADSVFLNLQREAVERCTNWDVKEPPPAPTMIVLKNDKGKIPLHRTGNREEPASIRKGRLKDLKKGDRLWVEFFHYKHNGRLHKAVRIFKLNADMAPVRKIFNVWYDSDGKKFKNIDNFQDHTLADAESFAVAWKMLWFGWIDSLPKPNGKRFLAERYEGLIMERLSESTATAKELGEAIGPGIYKLPEFNALIKQLMKAQKIVYIGSGKYAYLDSVSKVQNYGCISVHGHQVRLRTRLLKGDKVRTAIDSSWPIMLYEVVGKNTSTRRPIPLIIQRNDRGNIIYCAVHDINPDKLKGRTYFENIVIPGRYFMMIAGKYRIYPNRGIEKNDSQPITATLFFEGDQLKEVHFWRGYTAGMYRISPEGKPFQAELLTGASPRMILRNFQDKTTISAKDPAIEKWEDTGQFTEKRLRAFIWEKLEEGPKRYSELVNMLKDRRYPYLDAENILNAGKGPSEEFRIVRLPDGRYGAATRRKVREKRYFKFHERNYFTGKRWSNEDFVWFAYENDLVIAVTDKACDFSNWNNINYYYQQFRDTDNKLIYTTLIGSYISRVGSPFISVDNLDFDSYGNARLFNGRVLVNNQLSGKPVGKIASLFLERDKTDKNIYYIRRVDYWSGYGDRRYSVTKGEKGEVSISVSLKSGVPTYSIVDIKGECRKITPTASKRSCESAKIISEPEWQKVKKELEAAIKAEAEKHLVNARSLKEEDKAREAMGEYHLAFATDTLTEDEATKKEIINLSAKLCLDEAYGLLDGGYYRQAQELFEQVESFVTEDKKKFSRALAKAKVLAAYYGGLRYYDDGDYEFAIKKLNEALSYRKSLKADLIGEKKLVLIEEKLRKAEALCLYMEIRKLFLKKRYDEALDMFKQAESKGQGSYLRHLGVSLTMDLIEVCVAKEAGISESGAQMPLNEALETARLIIKNMHEHETLPAKDVIEKVLKDLNSPEAQRLLKLKPNCAKSALIKLSVARLAEMVELYDVIAEQLRDAKKDLYTELNEPAGADEMLEPYDDTGTEQQESEDESEGDFDYEARPRPDDEISKTHPAKRNKSGIAKGLAYSYNTNGSKTSYSKSWLKEIRKDVPGFEPLKNDNYKTRIEAALSDYAGTDIMKVLYKLIESSDWELVLSYILRIADQPMFTDDTREAREKLNLLEGTRNIAIGKITESKSSLAEKLLFQQVQAIEAIRTSA